MIPIPLHRYQYATFNLKAFIKVLVGGVGAGKSYATSARSIMFASENPGMSGGIVSPSLPMAKRSIIPTMRDMLDTHDIKYHYNKSDHYFDILDSRIWIMSGHEPKGLKGPNLGWCAIDEPFIQDRAVFETMIERLRIEGSTMRELLMTGTPEELNWGYDILVGKPHPNAAYIRVSSRANLPEETLQVLLHTYSKQMIKAMIDGHFVNINLKSAYYAFDPAYNVKPLKYNPRLPLILTCDFNKAPMCWNIIQEPTSYRIINHRKYPCRDTYVLDEIHVNGTNTFDCVDEFVDRWGERHTGPVFITGDYSGGVQGIASTLTSFEAITQRCQKQWGKDYVDLQITPNPHHKARLNVTNREFFNAAGERHMYIDPRCTFTIADYQFASIKEGTQSLDKKKRDPHHSDAVDYRVWFKAINEELEAA